MNKPAIIDSLVSSAIKSYLASNHFERFSPKAALIDMDGTLLNSMGNHTKAWHRMMSELGVKCSRDEFYLYEGMTGAATIDLLIRRAFHRPATDVEKTELYALKTGYFNEYPRVGIVPGADKVVKLLMEQGIVRVLVTGSSQPSNLARLDQDFPGGFPHNLRITARDVDHGKPSPEPYIKAMELAGVQPWEAIVIENAPLGVEAGARSRAFTIAVTTGPIAHDAMEAAGANLVLPSMEALATAIPELLGK
ncbi:MAG: HAD hydrolase-like protein [Muribaculum sp.]|nr:HAD hydrolase-like protein [Muribaculum sp.]